MQWTKTNVQRSNTPQKTAASPVLQRRYLHQGLFLAAAAVIGLLSAHAIWRVDYLPFTHDGLHHIFRLYTLDQEIRAGNWFPTRFPSMSFGYGSAILNYYPPLALYAWEALRLMGIGYVQTFQVGYTLFAVMAALSSYWLGTLLRDRWMGLITAFVYTFSPYVLFDLYARSALSEYLALALAPLLFVSLHKALIEDHWLRWLPFSAIVALIVYAHFLSLLLFLPFLAIYAACLWIGGHGRKPATLVRLVAAGLFGLVLSAFYWLPAIAERGGIRVPGSGDALASYIEGILPLAQLFSTSFTILLGYYSTDSVQLVNLPLLITLIGATVIGIWQSARGARRDRILFGGALTGLALSLVLVTVPGEALWRLLSPITVLQFPFRWLGPASLCLALIIGGAASVLMTSPRLRLGGGLLSLALMISMGVAVFLSLQTREAAMLRSLGVDRIRHEHIDQAGLLAYEYDEIVILRELDWVWALEFIPATSTLRDVQQVAEMVIDLQPLSSDLPAVDAQINVLAASANRLHATVSNDAPWQLSLHAFAVPGWRADVDGVRVDVQPISPVGLAGIDVPAGEHDVVISYGWTTLRWGSAILSLTALIVWLLAAARRRPIWLLAPLCLVLGFAGLGLTRQAEMPDPPPIQAAHYEFAGNYVLSGYGLAVDGRQVQMDLVWLTRRATPEAYKIFVHVIDDQGKLWHQADAHPLGFAGRTNRWMPGQVTFDAHRFDLPSDMPPGRYQVRTGLYLERDGSRLPVVDAAGQPIDDQVLLGYIEVGPLE